MTTPHRTWASARLRLALLVALLLVVTVPGPLVVLLDGRMPWISLLALIAAAAVAAVALWRRWQQGLLVTLPILLLLSIASLPADARDVVLQGSLWWPWCLLLVLCLLAVPGAMRPAARAPELRLEPLPRAPLPGPPRWVEDIRQALVPLLLLAPLLGLGTGTAASDDGVLTPMTSVAAALLFCVWTIGVWFFFLAPSQFADFERVQLARRLARRRMGWLRPVLWTLAGGGLGLWASRW